MRNKILQIIFRAIVTIALSAIPFSYCYADKCEELAAPYLAEGITSDMVYGSELQIGCLRNEMSELLVELFPESSKRAEIEATLYDGLDSMSKAIQRIRTENAFCIPSCGSMEMYVYTAYEADVLRNLIKGLRFQYLE